MTQQAQPPKPVRKTRQLTRIELVARFNIDATIDAVTGDVHVAPAWERDHLVPVTFPSAFGPLPKFRMHKDAVPVFEEFFQRIVDAHLSMLIHTVDGTYVPRLKRGANVPKTFAGLSRHARGIAIDLNAAQNPMGKPPAPIGTFGTLIPLANIADDLGIVCGVDWSGSSVDAQHFELGVKPDTD